MFIKSSVWKSLFGKEADKLERSNDDQCTYLLIEKEPVVNTFISVPKDKGMLNCAAFVAGIVQAMLEFKAHHIATVPEYLHRHLFRSDVPSTSAQASFEIELPTLKSASLQEHFRITAEELTQKYKQLLEEAALFPLHFPKPCQWRCETGWTRYAHNGSIEQYRATNTHRVSVVPGSEEARVVIGHNVGYDRARAKEPYEQKKSAVRFMDTMSMSIPMFGMADHQVSTYETDDSDFKLRYLCEHMCFAAMKMFRSCDGGKCMVGGRNMFR
ncbi:transport protein particle component, Bet3 [Necator americanus]|uniref:Transport protein particle component, Bet3 n=1 Tax=Necator americanus TaxID=51031 RepID=W2SFV9_NECAM|nr:transport protein particle component, Bet3 [Necator americanus]ETN68480.1 transport protein particle component, Bet3 [Necator americanus]